MPAGCVRQEGVRRLAVFWVVREEGRRRYRARVLRAHAAISESDGELDVLAVMRLRGSGPQRGIGRWEVETRGGLWLESVLGKP